MMTMMRAPSRRNQIIAQLCNHQRPTSPRLARPIVAARRARGLINSAHAFRVRACVRACARRRDGVRAALQRLPCLRIGAGRERGRSPRRESSAAARSLTPLVNRGRLVPTPMVPSSHLHPEPRPFAGLELAH